LIKVAAAGSLAVALPAQHHKSIPSPLANATVTFGEWRTDPPLDRFEGFEPNHNMLHILPNEVTIKAGGAVNFIISGFHLILVYDKGTQPGSIDVTDLITGGRASLINDPTNRIYRGLDPDTQPFDRIEAVHFPSRGRYLVICGVLPHFVNNGMFSFVNVLP
jgi:hypothetical protein